MRVFCRYAIRSLGPGKWVFDSLDRHCPMQALYDLPTPPSHVLIRSLGINALVLTGHASGHEHGG